MPCFMTKAYRSSYGEKLPTLSCMFKTPEEFFTNEKPDVSHFRIFGCLVYFHVPKEKRSKLDASRKKGTLVG